MLGRFGWVRSSTRKATPLPVPVVQRNQSREGPPPPPHLSQPGAALWASSPCVGGCVRVVPGDPGAGEVRARRPRPLRSRTSRRGRRCARGGSGHPDAGGERRHGGCGHSGAVVKLERCSPGGAPLPRRPRRGVAVGGALGPRNEGLGRPAPLGSTQAVVHRSPQPRSPGPPHAEVQSKIQADKQKIFDKIPTR